jgi:hypothetical protein
MSYMRFYFSLASTPTYHPSLMLDSKARSHYAIANSLSYTIRTILYEFNFKKVSEPTNALNFKLLFAEKPYIVYIKGE